MGSTRGWRRDGQRLAPWANVLLGALVTLLGASHCTLPARVDVWADVTEVSGLSFANDPPDGLRSLADRMVGGICVVDVDGSAPLDLFFAVRGGSRLFVARAALDYEDATAARGLMGVGRASGCLAFDADGDDDDDLFVSGLGSVRFFENTGGTFVDRSDQITAVFGASTLYTSLAAADLDDDGDLDVAAAAFMDFGVVPDHPCTPIDCAGSLGAFPAAPNLVLMRGADGRYVDHAAELAPDMTLAEPTLMVALARIEGEGPVDLFVGNDLGNQFHDRVLRRASDGVFSDVSDVVGLQTNQHGYGVDTMGWTTADVDGDGRLDHATSSFEGDATALFVCGADGWCEDQAHARGLEVTSESVRWGPAFLDADLDGDPDLVEGAGHVYPDADLAALGATTAFAQSPHFYRNDGGHFELVPEAALAAPRALRGLAVVDLDDDGLADVVFASVVGEPLVLHNVAASHGHWLRVVLRGPDGNLPAAGAIVRVVTTERSVVRARTIGEGYLGNFDPRLTFGLGEARSATVDVRWPDGHHSERTGVDVDREIVIDVRSP